jgi:hypothetical protein
VALFALATECSTPFLSAMLTFRRIEGWPLAVNITSFLFATTFVLTRPLMFGAAVLYNLYLRVVIMDVSTISWLDRSVMDGMLLLYVAGWVLQLVWAQSIVPKCARELIKVAGSGRAKEKSL